MSEVKNYYTLRYEHADALHRAGDRLYNAADVLHIGQTDYCEARLVNESPFEDAVLAVVRPQEGGEGWVLVPVSPYKEHEVRVGGTPIDCLHLLRDGDRISFAGSRQELLFNIHHDSEYLAKGITPVKAGISRWTVSALVVLPLILVGALGWWFNERMNREKFTDAMIQDVENAVFRLRIDSFQLVAVTGKDTVVLRSHIPPLAPSGTAFLTSDSLLVTARHCLQPWLNDEDTLGLDTSKIEPLYTRWALQAETHNQLVDDGTQWEVVSFLTLITSLESDLSLRSTDFFVNTSRDNIVEIGDFSHEYYWRSITVRPSYKEMALGDMAFMRAPEALMSSQKGKVIRARGSDMRSLLKPNASLLVLGYPNLSHQSGKRLQNVVGKLNTEVLFDDEGLPGELLCMNVDLTEGYSGGPIMMRSGSGMVCVGLVSVTDNLSKDVKYAVPVTEIQRCKTQQE